MKFTKQDIEVLRANIDGFFQLEEKDGKSRQYWLAAYKKNGHSLRRFLFDLFYATGLHIGDGVGMSAKPGRFDSRTIICDCNDDHIFTALKKATGITKL